MKINTLMKSLTTTALIALTLLGTVMKSEADCWQAPRVYNSGHASCGTPIYTERYLIGYDRCGNPIWGTRVVRAQYQPVLRQRYVAPRPIYRQETYRYENYGRRSQVQVQGRFCR